MVAWLDAAQAADLRRMVMERATDPARRLLATLGFHVPMEFDLRQRAWHEPFLRELNVLLDGEEADDDDSTSMVPDYAKFATDMRDHDRLQSLTDRLAREEDVDLGAAFGWED